MLDDLTSLPNLAQYDVVLTGNWALSPSGQREWNGVAIGETTLVGILFLSCGNRTYWAKSGTPHIKVAPQGYYESQPISNKLFMGLSLHGTLNVRIMYSLGSPIGIYQASTMVSSKDYLPPISSSRTVQTGHLLTFASLESTPQAKLYAMFLAKQDVKMRRKHIWGLKKPLLASLKPPLLEVFTFGRFGELTS